MKIKHNKKRNTAFVFEALVREATVAVIKENHEVKDKAVALIKKHFAPGTLLYKDLQNYRSLYEKQNLDRDVAEKIIKEAKLASRLLDTQGLFISQSDLIDDVNKELTPEVFNNFVPNYKTLASIAHMFSDKSSPKNSVILENKIIDNMVAEEDQQNILEPIDNLVLNSFVGKFNEKYQDQLLENQKVLLNYYITSFADNGLALKTYLNSEITRLKETFSDSLESEIIKEDEELSSKTKQVIEKLDNFYKEGINEKVVLTVLKTQELAQEITEDGN
ncbi:MAG: hypothetical protein CMI54_01920 [Parcubacteria group bacterium]|jgi:hypothetical protein|nr:hypothetical protein [Parcubacteria group bacterium]|tara:strand:- start:3028 stop:3855 length:828 start_codon:yes stop_codon:yes gene_type:complete